MLHRNIQMHTYLHFIKSCHLLDLKDTFFRKDLSGKNLKIPEKNDNIEEWYFMPLIFFFATRHNFFPKYIDMILH